MPPVRVLRACDKSASPAVQAPAVGAVCFSHQLPVWLVSVSVAVMSVTPDAESRGSHW